jgi:uncharacterized protein (TIGR03083 family)
METARLLDCLAADVARLRKTAIGNLAAPVPTCPGWTVADLVRHLANGYLNVVVRRLRMPAEVPVQDLSGEDPVAAFDRCYATMVGEFAARDPDDRVGRASFETVRFWIRRMAHETVIHRIDAELAAALPVTGIPADLAVDGVDEMLTVFLVGETRRWSKECAADLSEWDGRWILVAAGGTGWRLTVHPHGVEVTPMGTDTHSTDDPVASVRGAPADLMCWLYNRPAGDRGAVDRVVTEGDDDRVAQLRRLLTSVTGVG